MKIHHTDYKLYKKARDLARYWHKGQMMGDTGLDYFKHHLEPVAFLAISLGGDTAGAIGWTHDTLEDTKCTLPTLFERMGIVITMAVGLLTRQRGEKYDSYIQRLVKASNDVPDLGFLMLTAKTADLSVNYNNTLVDSTEPGFHTSKHIQERTVERIVKYQSAISRILDHVGTQPEEQWGPVKSELTRLLSLRENQAKRPVER